MKHYENEAQLLSGIFEQAAREYEGMAIPVSCKRLSGGERNDIFKLDFHEGPPLVLRIIHHKTELAGVHIIDNPPALPGDPKFDFCGNIKRFQIYTVLDAVTRGKKIFQI